MSPPPWDGVLIFAFSRSGRDDEVTKSVSAMTYELTLRTKRCRNHPVPRGARNVEISQFKNACPPPRGTGSGPPYKFFLVSGTTGMTIDRDPRHVSGHVDVRARGIDRAREKQIHVPIFPRGNLAHIADTR